MPQAHSLSLSISLSQAPFGKCDGRCFAWLAHLILLNSIPSCSVEGDYGAPDADERRDFADGFLVVMEGVR